MTKQIAVKDSDSKKKTTIRKKMTLRDFLNLVYFFETGQKEADLSGMCPDALCCEDIRVMRLTKVEKAKMDEFLDGIPFGMSFKALADSVPRVSNSLVVTPHQAVKANPAPAVASVVEPAVDKMPTSIDQIDIKGMVESLERGEMKVKKLVVMLEEQYGSANKIMSALVPGEIKRMRRQYKDCPDLLNVFIVAEEIVYPKVKDILSEPEPPAEETMQRFQKHTLYSKKESKNSKVIEYAASCDKIDLIEGKRITFDLDFEKFVDYSNAEDMKEDVLYLVNAGKIKIDQEVDIFGKSTSGAKIIAQIYKKYPNGAPGAGLFFSSRKEAFLAGQLEI